MLADCIAGLVDFIHPAIVVSWGFLMTDLAARLDAAVRLATEAGELALRMRPAPGAAIAKLKGAQDWLTEADGAVEAFLATELAKLFPEDGFQGEETGLGRPGVATWVVDPIDGTSNFARGATRWCVSLGLIENGEAVVGVLVAPALGEVFAARRGHGATLNGAPIHVATTDDARRGMIEVGWSPRRPNSVYQAIVAHFMAAGAMVRSGGSGAMGLADVAAGRIDGYVEAHINLWDVAAGLCILAESGAAVSPFLAGAGPIEGDAILAAAPGLWPLVAQTRALME
jgi:myo-inositol-1(or 4)-monophosphatase